MTTDKTPNITDYANNRLELIRIDYGSSESCSNTIINTIVNIYKKHNEDCGNRSDAHLTASTQSRLNQAIMIADLLTKHHQAKVILCQHPVLDEDYGAEFDTFYSKTFAPHPRYCSRLHFFSASPHDNEDAIDFIDRLLAENSPEPITRKSTKDYLGFVTIRPIRTCPIGTTIIPPPPECRYLTIKDTFRVTVAGRELWVTGAPFMQQDSAVGACVQAALWMALRAVRKRDGKSAYFVSDITNAATSTQLVARIYPNRDGINGQQLMQAMHILGYHGAGIRLEQQRPSPILTDETTESILRSISESSASETKQNHAWPDPTWIKQDLYPYLESGIPVILETEVRSQNKTEQHALLLIGHGWNKDIDKKTLIHYQNNWSNYHRIPVGELGHICFEYPPVCYATSYFIHDDSRGPYFEIPDTRPLTGGISVDSLQRAYPLLPKDVYLDAGEALTVFKTAMSSIFMMLINGGFISIEKIRKMFIVRPQLLRRQEFREWATSIKNGTLQKYYRRKFYPSRVWVFSICHDQDYHKSPNNQNTQFAELVIDPTGDIDDLPILSFHINTHRLAISTKTTSDKTKNKGVVIDYDRVAHTITAFHIDELDE